MPADRVGIQELKRHRLKGPTWMRTALSRTLPVLGALVILPAGAQAETTIRQFGNIVFDVPARWEEVGANDGRMKLDFDSDEDRCTGCEILIGLGTTDRGPIDAWRDAQAAKISDDAKVVGKPQFLEDEAGGKPVRLMLRQVDDDGTQKFQAFFAIDLGQRYELVAFEGRVRDQASLDETLSILNTTVVPMIDGLRYVSEGAKPVLGPPKPGPLHGPWFGSAIYNHYNGLSGVLEMDVATELMLFFPDGRFYDGIPDTGTVPLDVAALVASGETHLGNYDLVGDKLALHYVDGDDATLDVVNETAIRSGRVTMRPADVPQDGFRFAGTIQSSHYTSFIAGSGVTGGVGSDHTQVFRADGTFTDASFVGVSGTFDAGGGMTATSKKPESLGHYEVKDGMITLTPPTGEQNTTWIILPGGTEIVIGGQPVSQPEAAD